MTQRFQFPEAPENDEIQAETNTDYGTSSQENVDDEEEYTRPAGMSTPQKIIFISICGGVLAILIGLIIGLIAFSGRSTDDGLILENVFVGELNLGGMTIEEATNSLHLATDNTFTKKDMIIRIYNDTIILHAKDTHAELDVDAAVQAAYQYGRGRNHAENLRIRNTAHKRSYTIPMLPYLELDLSFIRESAEAYCGSHNSTLKEPMISLEGVRPIYDPDTGNVTGEHQRLRISLGTPECQLESDDLYNRILDSYSMNRFLLEYSAPQRNFPTEVNARALFDQYCSQPQDAYLNTTNYTVVPEVYGYGFDVVALQKQIDAADYGDNIDITLEFLKPDIIAEELSDTMFRYTIAEFRSISDISTPQRDRNLLLSCAAIHDRVILPGESFSFNAALGSMTAAAGYQTASISTYNGEALGGGISQTASTLYYCALLANLDVTERNSHTYVVDFIDMGTDAYVDGAQSDLRFRNNTNAPIRICAEAEGGVVAVSLYSAKQSEYLTELQFEITEKQEPETTYSPITPETAGVQEGDVLVEGITGYQITVSVDTLDPVTGDTVTSVPVSKSQYAKRDEVIASLQPVNETEATTEPVGTETDTLLTPPEPLFP